MIRKIALAAIFVQVAATAALAAELVIYDGSGKGVAGIIPSISATPQPAAGVGPIHTVLVLQARAD